MAYITFQPHDYFNTLLYTDNGANRTLTGVGFQPDWVWIKTRNHANSHNLFDAVRGANKVIRSNNDSAQATTTDTLTAFTSDGFSLGVDASGYGVNYDNKNEVAWNWKANGAGSTNTDGNMNTSDIFDQFFNSGGATSRNYRPGQDLNANIRVTLTDIDNGMTKTIRYKRRIFDRDRPPQTCRSCNGRGMVNLMGPFQTKCGQCQGQGRIHTHKIVEQQVEFDIPKGVKNGERIFYAGFGNEDIGGMGNLYIVINEVPHPKFQREGNNLITETPLTFPDLILGTSIEVETLKGLIKVNIEPNSKPFDRLRIRGKGLHNESGVGNLIVILKLIVPEKINEQERKLLEELKLSENFNNIKY